MGYVKTPEELELFPGVVEAVARLNRAGARVVLTTNQSGIARELLTTTALESIHARLRALLEAGGASLDAIYYCPHHPTEGQGPYRISCECRKPKGGLARRAAAQLNLDLARSYVVGDQPTDMELASGIGAKGILIGDREAEDERREREAGFVVVEDLWAAAQWIARDLRRES